MARHVRVQRRKQRRTLHVHPRAAAGKGLVLRRLPFQDVGLRSFREKRVYDLDQVLLHQLAKCGRPSVVLARRVRDLAIPMGLPDPILERGQLQLAPFGPRRGLDRPQLSHLILVSALR